MTKIWIVYLRTYFDEDHNEIKMNYGGILKPYAVFTDRDKAIEVEKLLKLKNEFELIDLKILKSNENLKEVITHVLAVDNYDSIIKKLKN
jgi:hypothetical protein